MTSVATIGCTTSKHFKIEIAPVFNRGGKATFRAFLTSFSDSFSSTWNEEPVYARMDPIATFQRTSRQMSVAFKVLSESEEQAKKNVINIQKLVKCVYPKWDASDLQNPAQAAPVVEIKFSSLIVGDGLNRGLAGYMGGLQIDHELDAGFIFSGDGKAMLPKEISISFTFTVLHESDAGLPPGTFGSRDFERKTFPYGWGGVAVPPGTPVDRPQDATSEGEISINASGGGTTQHKLPSGLSRSDEANINRKATNRVTNSRPAIKPRGGAGVGNLDLTGAGVLPPKPKTKAPPVRRFGESPPL